MKEADIVHELWLAREAIRSMFNWKEDIMTMEHEAVVAQYVMAFFLAKSFKQVEEIRL